jgi:hypothetical protein
MVTKTYSVPKEEVNYTYIVNFIKNSLCEFNGRLTYSRCNKDQHIFKITFLKNDDLQEFKISLKKLSKNVLEKHPSKTEI